MPGHAKTGPECRMASAQEAAVPGRTAGGQSAALSELEAQKMYMRQKVQQRQQEVKMQQQQQAPTVCASSASSLGERPLHVQQKLFLETMPLLRSLRAYQSMSQRK